MLDLNFVSSELRGIDRMLKKTKSPLSMTMTVDELRDLVRTDVDANNNEGGAKNGNVRGDCDSDYSSSSS